jgi:hypothetical protein
MSKDIVQRRTHLGRPLLAASAVLLGSLLGACRSSTPSVSMLSNTRPATTEQRAAAAATYDALANPSNCAVDRWVKTIDEVWGPDKYLYGDEWPDASGRILPEARRLADAYQAFADGLRTHRWPSDVSTLIADLADLLDSDSTVYRRASEATDFDSYISRVSKRSTSNGPSAEIRRRLGLPAMYDDGKSGCRPTG